MSQNVYQNMQRCVFVPVKEYKKTWKKIIMKKLRFFKAASNKRFLILTSHLFFMIFSTLPRTFDHLVRLKKFWIFSKSFAESRRWWKRFLIAIHIQIVLKQVWWRAKANWMDVELKKILETLIFWAYITTYHVCSKTNEWTFSELPHYRREVSSATASLL